VSRLKARVKSGQNATPGTAAGYKPYALAVPGPPSQGTSSPQAVSTTPGSTSVPVRPRTAQAPVTAAAGSGASPAAVMVMPLALVEIVRAQGTPYVTAGMQDLAPIFTSDGAPVPATAPGRWAQLRAAGRP
jgi:hypothetical protein